MINHSCRRITYITATTIPSRYAHTMHIMKMCQGWANAGHTVHLILPELTEDVVPPPIDLYNYYGVNRNFMIIRLPWPQYKRSARLWFWNAAVCAAKLNTGLMHTRSGVAGLFAAELGMQVIFEQHRNLLLEYKQPFLRRLIQDVTQHLSSCRRYWRIKMRLARREWLEQNKKSLNRDVVYSYRNLLITRGFATEEQIHRRLCKHSQLAICVSITHNLKKELIQTVPALADKITVLPDGADLPSQQASQPKLVSKLNSHIDIGYCGHLYEGKGMEIIAELVKHCPEAHFHIVGGLPADLDKWQAQLAGYPNITFYGHVAPYLTDAYIAQFDICLLPNQHRVFLANKKNNIDIGKYNSPMKLFQYMAAGKPIIASDIPVLGEVLSDDQNALLCPPEDITAWQRAIQRLATRPELSIRLGSQARQDLINQYTWTARAKTILKHATARP